MVNKKMDLSVPDENIELQVSEGVLRALEMLVRILGLVNGTITIRARGGNLCRGIEVVNKVDVLSL